MLSYRAKETADIVKVIGFKTGRLSWISDGPNLITWVLKAKNFSSWNQRDAVEEDAGEMGQRRDETDVEHEDSTSTGDFEDEEGAISQGMQAASRSWEHGPIVNKEMGTLVL